MLNKLVKIYKVKQRHDTQFVFEKLFVHDHDSEQQPVSCQQKHPGTSLRLWWFPKLLEKSCILSASFTMTV
jgi:hypothetical protein